MSKWWLISNEDVNAVRKGLMAPMHLPTSFNCPERARNEHCAACDGDELRKQALHALDTGLNVTTVVPDDFKVSVVDS